MVPFDIAVHLGESLCIVSEVSLKKFNHRSLPLYSEFNWDQNINSYLKYLALCYQIE